MRKIIVFLIFISFTSALMAENLTTGPAILQLGASARSASLQGAYTASAGDVDSMFYNPGGLAAIGRSQIGFTHAEMTLNTQYNVLQYARPSHFGAWGLSVARLGVDDIDGRTADRQAAGQMSAGDTLAGLTFAYDVHARVGIGSTIKFLESRIASERTSTFAFDLGTVVRYPGKPLWFGFSILNVGQGLRYVKETTPLPLTWALGAAARMTPNTHFLLDVKQNTQTEKANLVAGVEYYLLPTVSLRLGTGSAFGSENSFGSAALENWRGGVGLSLRQYQLDYAVSTDDETEPLHRISLSRIF